MNSKIVENYYQKLKDEFENKPLQLSREEIISLIREIVREEIAKNNIQIKPAPESEYLSIKEAALYLKLAVTTLYEKTSQKTIPFHKRDKKLYFKKDDLTNWLLNKDTVAKAVRLPALKKHKKAA